MGLFSANGVDVQEVHDKFGTILLPDETVVAAFKSIRDTVFLTDQRFVLVDVQGITGSRVAMHSVPYRSISHFAVETAGTLDLDSDLSVWMAGTATPITVKISRKADPQAIQRLLAERVLAAKR